MKHKPNNQNDYYTNYTKKVTQNFIGGLLWALLFAVIYGIYKLIDWVL